MDAADTAPKVFLVDKGYDADLICKDMVKRGGSAMILIKRNRLVQTPVDGDIYALRNMIERCFNRGRLAKRCDKIAVSYHGFIKVV
jgi:hypothetical protein